MVRTSSGADDACLKDVEFAAAIHLPLHQLEFGDLPLGLAVGPRQSDCRDDGGARHGSMRHPAAVN